MNRSLMTRIAPTPSGYLHRGNLLNMALIAGWADAQEASITLRIDDADAPRVRTEYLQDIFDSLDFLGIAVDRGPHSLAECTEWSQNQRFPRYRSAALALREAGAFVCSCSRTQVSDSGTCVRECRATHTDFHIGETSLRMPLAQGDVVVWRRDDLPSYHLASVMDDAYFTVTHVIRGEDLESSTALQAQLAEHLRHLGVITDFAFRDTLVAHHELVSADGRKLSKSSLDQTNHEPRTKELRAWVNHEVQRILPTLTFHPAHDFR